MMRQQPAPPWSVLRMSPVERIGHGRSCPGGYAADASLLAARQKRLCRNVAVCAPADSTAARSRTLAAALAGRLAARLGKIRRALAARDVAASRAVRSRLAVAVLAGLLAGCMTIGSDDPTPVVWYELAVPPPASTASRADERSLSVDVVAGSVFYDAIGIAYSRAPAERLYYQYARWTEPVAARLARLVERDLRARGIFAAVGPLAARSRSALRLHIVVEDFYHDASSLPGVARVGLSAELLSRAGVPLARREFRQAAPLASGNAPAAVAAFDVAVGAILGELADWLPQAAPPAR